MIMHKKWIIREATFSVGFTCIIVNTQTRLLLSWINTPYIDDLLMLKVFCGMLFVQIRNVLLYVLNTLWWYTFIIWQSCSSSSWIINKCSGIICGPNFWWSCCCTDFSDTSVLIMPSTKEKNGGTDVRSLFPHYIRS